MPAHEDRCLAIGRSVASSPKPYGQLSTGGGLGSIEQMRDSEQLNVDLVDGEKEAGQDIARLFVTN